MQLDLSPQLSHKVPFSTCHVKKNHLVLSSIEAHRAVFSLVGMLVASLIIKQHLFGTVFFFLVPAWKFTTFQIIPQNKHGQVYFRPFGKQLRNSFCHFYCSVQS